MARKRASVPSLADVARRETGRAGRQYSETLIRAPMKPAKSTPTTTRTHTTERTVGAGRRPSASNAVPRRNTEGISYETALALLDAREGDDSALLPYQPTPSINPPRPRTLAAGYDKDTRTLRVRFRDGTPWEYYDVPPDVYRRFRRVKSPGRFINRVLNQYPYARGNF